MSGDNDDREDTPGRAERAARVRHLSRVRNTPDPDVMWKEETKQALANVFKAPNVPPKGDEVMDASIEEELISFSQDLKSDATPAIDPREVRIAEGRARPEDVVPTMRRMEPAGPPEMPWEQDPTPVMVGLEDDDPFRLLTPVDWVVEEGVGWPEPENVVSDRPLAVGSMLTCRWAGCFAVLGTSNDGPYCIVHRPDGALKGMKKRASSVPSRPAVVARKEEQVDVKKTLDDFDSQSKLEALLQGIEDDDVLMNTSRGWKPK